MSKVNSRQHAKQKKQQPRWPLFVLAAGGFLLLIIGAGLAFSQSMKLKALSEVAGSPNLKVDKEKVDLGDVKLGQIVQASFQITNVGEGTLRFAEKPYIEVIEGC
jgi:hypothetical protein